ncbi:MAG TPA: alpha-glucosidase/alpha-galactosidase, partial [Ktedonobacteraceae bacterium]|nr:alpha-glucosidase/alpha-galactosidase [Ktedonobacteraceae bacterium]
PQYQAALPEAQQHLAEAVVQGTRVQLRTTHGAARLHTRSIEELQIDRDEARANAAAADKGKMTH